MSEPTSINLRVTGMDCAACALTLERGVAQLDGIDDVRVNFATTELVAHGTANVDAISARIRALGYGVADPNTAPPVITSEAQGALGFFRFMLNSTHTRISLIAAALLALTLPLLLLESLPAIVLSAQIIQIAIMIAAGYSVAQKGLRALLVGRQITIDLLMTIAAIGALVIGEVAEAATVMVLFTLGEALEGYTADRARASLRGILALAPDQATVLRPCMDCQGHMGREGYSGGPCPWCGTHEDTIPTSDVHIGDTVLIRPGERVPVDGRVLTGATSINQATITGESVPVAKMPDSEVFAGTINFEGAIEVEVTHAPSDSTISQIVRLVEQAQSQRSEVERFIDRFASWYTPAVVGVAILMAAVPPLLFGAPFFDTPGAHGWLYRAMALLIIACPCALVISTPVTMVSALTRLARSGILIKGGQYLDALSRIRAFAFDKTGTLTQGRPVIVQVRGTDCNPDDAACRECDDMVAVAAAVERRSEHPLARAIITEAEHRGIAHRYAPAVDVHALAGRGVEGTLGADQIVIGSHTLIHDQAQSCEPLHTPVEQAEASGETIMMITRNGTLMGFMSVADTLRESTREALRSLKAVSADIHTIMLTGDNASAAQRIVETLGSIDAVRANLLPQEKVAAVEALKQQHGSVAMIGDGINDAPALAAATVGIAMGGAGSAQAMETADVVLMQDDLTHLPEAVNTSRRARRIIEQNIVFSLVVKLAFLLLALTGAANLWMAVFADVGASLLVTLNGMRMLRREATKPGM